MIGYPRNAIAQRMTQLLISAGLRIAAGLLVAVVSFFLPAASQAANAPPAMIVPGQFSVSATGGFTYTIPIAVPPGTAGMTPALSLDYSSQGGDGLEGLGWVLSGLPSIGRCPRTIAQDDVHGGVNYDANDRFCMDGQRLVAIGGSYGGNGTIYRTEIEGFSKIESFGAAGTGPSYFKVWTKSGQIMEFGNTADSKIYPVKADGTGLMTTVRTWAANKISDTKGNYLTVTYTNDTTNGQVYPNRIDYTGNATASLSPYASVQFSYTTRSDPILSYQAGAIQTTTQLLTSIRTYVGATLITNYKLAYTLATSGAQHDELTSITQCDAGTKCLKPTTFGWQGSRDQITLTQSSISVAQAPTEPQVNAVNLWPSDFNGDGLTDVLAETLGCGVFFSNQSGVFDTTPDMLAHYKTAEYEDTIPPKWVPFPGTLCNSFGARPTDFDGDSLLDGIVGAYDTTGKPFFVLLKNDGVSRLDGYPSIDDPTKIPFGQFNLAGDFNGDGRGDFLTSDGSLAIPEFSNGDGTYTAGPGYSGLGNLNKSIVPPDFDGDGCSDVLAYGASVIQYTCNPAVAQTTTPSGWVTSYAITLGDFNGDGKTDVLAAKSGTTLLYLSTGTGFAGPITLPQTDWNKYTIVTGDWNGDGKTDVALIADDANPSTGKHYGVGTSHQLWLSNGTGFFLAASIANTNSEDKSQNGEPAIKGASGDWNSDGASDLWIQKASGDKLEKVSYVPELMTTVSNGLGIVTTVDYDRINKNGIFYAKCSNGTFICGDVYPTQDVDGALYAVSEIDSSNGVGGTYVSTYSYGQAKVDVTGRGFLGFGSVVIKDLQTGIVQTTNYLTRWPYLGLITSQTKVCPAPTCSTAVTLNATNNVFTNVNLGTGTDGVARIFVELRRTIVTSNDLDGTVMPTVGTTYVYDCDTGSPSICSGTSPTGFGNATRITACQWDLVNNQCLSGGWNKTTINTYSNDASRWYLGRLLSANVESVVGDSDLTRQTSYTYLTASGLLNTESVEPETSSDSTLSLGTNYDYDDFGNKTAATTVGCVWVSSSNCSTTASTATRRTTTEFDTTTLHGQFATKITNALGQHESWAYAATNNIAFGLPSSHTGPNGLTTSWAYDSFGRKTLEVRPDGNKTAIAYTYCAGLPPGESCPTNAQFDVIVTPQDAAGAQNGPISVTYYDGLSRALAADFEGFDAPGTGCTASAPCWIRVETRYDANGRVARTSRPYFLTASPHWTVFAYDTLGRVTQATYADGSVTTYGFNGLTTTVTNDKGQTTTTLKNAQGLIASMTDTAGNATTYVYDAFGDLLTVTDPASHVTTNTYDIRGRKLSSSDPDMGSWSYVYDGFGELYSQTDAKSQITTLTYDALGRVLTRTEPDLTSTWTYDTAAHGIGQLASATTGSGYTRTLAYDNLSRPTDVTLTIGGTAYLYHTTYNPDGRVSTVDYPSGFTALNSYTALGYQYQVRDYNAGTVLWTAKSRDAELHLLTQTSGNGITTAQAFDVHTGRLLTIRAGTSDNVANQSYAYDTLGNLTSRSWLNDSGSSVKENACYDNLNRLTGTLVMSGTACTGTGAVTVAYDAIGNITSKSDVCATANCMVYGSSAGPHAITSITGTYNGVTNPSFTYDANGNMVAGAGRTVTSTSFNMAALITDGANSAALTYDTEHARIKMVALGTSAGTTLYLNDPVSGAMSESFTASGAPSPTWRDYIMADGLMIGMRTPATAPPPPPPKWGAPTQWGSFAWSGNTAPGTMLYFVLDQLGSISVVTNDSGAVVERDSYDAWGKRRNADGTAAQCGTISSTVTRGFTGQEMMDSTCLINFNARIYDPGLGRFMSADPTTETVYDLQILNRYSYVGNNPLSLTDPSGLCFLGCFWQQSWFKAIVAIAVAIVLEQPEFGLSSILRESAAFVGDNTWMDLCARALLSSE